MKTAAVFGAGGFIGHHLVSRLKSEGYHVIGFDLKYPEFEKSNADDFVIRDLREPFSSLKYDEIYQLAADMGGAGYIFTGEHDADVMSNSALINLNTCRAVKGTKTKVFYSSSACIYPEYNQLDPANPRCAEASAYPAAPDSEYGWEKLFSERLYLSYMRNYNLDVRIARFHNIFGPQSCYNNGKEKYPAAICRKVAEAPTLSSIEIWGDGKATRSFLYIDECLDGIRRLMESNYPYPLNIGSDEMISVEQLARMVIDISGKELYIIRNMNKPQGVRGRNSDNGLILKSIGWKPDYPLRRGMEKLYSWVLSQVKQKQFA